MPMNFPDMKSLERHAEIVGFRKPNEGESEDSFRMQLAAFVEPMDFIESMEIRNKVGWDKFDDEQNRRMLLESGRRNSNKV
jgi:hypothetical protein